MTPSYQMVVTNINMLQICTSESCNCNVIANELTLMSIGSNSLSAIHKPGNDFFFWYSAGSTSSSASSNDEPKDAVCSNKENDRYLAQVTKLLGKKIPHLLPKKSNVPNF